ncbi:glycosyltransferase family 1 protein [Siphonobacter sp. SORGH_AS_1065]|uniref:glycosyltransferase family 4 protein n=1 Tax=Siphonobacter sp. SORGH_AS_1065 TaxID=3041795 RepID=UPI002781A053|nr:glycosyltransferase family 1 protein [Siphonobacter sp. SORGH_AS_1065]MDQ1087550.1 glycosyltransferase involved in cell wall biosynthesis [Siphonobacter sp. SORGH_AS_1065]
MKILFDHQIYNNQRFGGISRYFYELSTGLLRNKHEVKNAVAYSDNEYTNDIKLFDKKYLPSINFKGKTTIKTYLNKNHTIGILKKNEFDIFHPTYYDTYFLKKNVLKKPLVVTFHDLIHEKFHYKYPRELKNIDEVICNNKTLLSEASKIIAISHATKRDIIEYYGTDQGNIEVIHLASSLSNSNVMGTVFKEPYFLFIGNRAAYKNFTFFIQTSSDFLRKDRSLKVLCAGGGQFNHNEISLFKKLDIDKQVDYYPIENDETLAQLYSDALFFVFPSEYEGFGIPTLEAFNCGCPTILSNTSSLMEVGGDAALYFNSNESQSLYHAINSLLFSESLRGKYKIKAMSRASLFNWQKTVDETVKVYKSVL